MAKHERALTAADLESARIVQRVDLNTVNSIDVEARTIEVVFTTGEIIPHYIQTPRGCERVLTRIMVGEDTIMLDKMPGQPVLDSHMDYSARQVIGVIEEAWVKDGKGFARLRFSAADDVATTWKRIEEKILRNCSLGFAIRAAEAVMEDGPNGPVEIWNLTKVEPFEISMVPIGADSGAKVQARDAGQNVTIDAEENSMSKENTQGAASSTVAAQTTLVQAPDASAILRQERERVAAIREAGTSLGIEESVIQAAEKSDVTVDAFRADAIKQFAARGQAATAGIGGATAAAVVTADATERFVQGATLALMAKGGLKNGERNEFSGMTMAELARQSLVLRGAKPGADRMQMIGLAFTQAGSHTTSDFANILANVMGKGALQGWEAAVETFEKWTRSGTLTDFKATKRVGLGLIESLPSVAEGANYSYGTIGDRGETIALATYGKMLKITRQAIINDDLSLLTEVPRKMGMAAKRTIGNLVYAILTGNPTMSDGTALFHSNHKNLAASGAALSVTSLSAARTAMRTQKEDPTKADSPALNIAPAYLVVPSALETMAVQLMNSIVDPTANKGHATNPVAGMAEVVTDARLDAASAVSWYLAANGNIFDTIEVAYLDGIKEPYIEQKDAWTTDGAELKVRIDAGVAPLDFRTLYKNPGA
ncbi:prohead protease/major capsid protein fusion protein [Paenirhodobacter sp. CAU 1674]|uniref:prohead protease/major capsid protein fusion protein n=1 Tax=Paenirhodobacter sp. CAU 1674 TaxID=3032596 RepID=UPI0023DAB117|nr:prohead protease/major capsid protein fusion protein [Paenirhodobacter sp. CAU 1674]MDF2140852.1 Mu-like prophage major head subunit gpT family protein [Paenirhodobacter sp. CAU 1674]